MLLRLAAGLLWHQGLCAGLLRRGCAAGDRAWSTMQRLSR